MKLPLFVGAHRAELQAFFEHFTFVKTITLKPFEHHKIACFKEGYILLIAGGNANIRGESQKALIEACNTLKNKLSHIVFLGFAGALKKDLQLGDVVLIQSAIAISPSPKNTETTGQFSGKLDAKSIAETITPLRKCFHTHHPEAQWSCVTHPTPVDCSNVKKKIGIFADVVDMELYWQMEALEKNDFSLPYFSLKIISDYADEATNKDEIMKNSKKWSKMLYLAAKKDCFHFSERDFLVRWQKKDHLLKNLVGMKDFFKKKTENWAKLTIDELLKNIDSRLSFRERKDLEECLINDLRTELGKNTHDDLLENSPKMLESWRKIKKQWLLKHKKSNKTYLKKFLSKKTLLNIV